jgi:Protein of unknown function (DUF2897)
MSAYLIILLVVAFLIGGLLVLRSSARTGMPPADVLQRAQKRAREQAEAEKKADSGEGKP